MFSDTGIMRFWLGTSLALLTAAQVLGTCVVLLGAAPTPDTTVTVGDEEQRAVQAAMGETIVLRLPSTPGTGFTWRITEIHKEHVAVLGEAAHETPPTPALGASGYQVFRFLPQKPGSARVTLQYLRPWEAHAEPIRRFNLDITVHDDQPGS